MELKQREMPDDLVTLIQDFVHARTRPDWRTCKAAEALPVKLLIRDEPHIVADQIGAEYWDLIKSQSLYELITRYPSGPPSEEGYTTVRLKRVWRA